MNDKRQQLIDAALDLFYTQGINAVGINEVLKVSGIAKKTLYHHFESKEALVIATLAQRDHAFVAWLDKVLTGATSDAELISRLFQGLSAWFNDEVVELSQFRGCFFINTAAQCQAGSAIEEYCRQHKGRVRALLQDHLRSRDEALLEMICLLKEGAIVTAYVNRDLKAADKCLPWLLRHLDNAGAN